MSQQQLTHAVEDYLKAVYSLGGGGQRVGTNALAERLRVAPASVTGMLKRLSEMGYVDYTPRQGVELSTKGLEVALEIIRHHRLLELFFVKRLGMSWAQAHNEAEVLEHFISEELEKVLDRSLGYPDEDPQGSPIPTPEGQVSTRDLPTLDEAPVDVPLVIRRVHHDDREMTNYIQQLGLVPGTPVVVREVSRFDGPIRIAVRGKSVHVGPKLASAIQVEPAAQSKKDVANGEKENGQIG